MSAFESIVQKQIQLQGIFYPNSDLPKHDGQLFSTYMLGLESEVGEVLQADKTWKPFHKGDRDPQAVKQELADCFLFLINAALAQGMSAWDMLDEMRKKQVIVEERMLADKKKEP